MKRYPRSRTANILLGAIAFFVLTGNMVKWATFGFAKFDLLDLAAIAAAIFLVGKLIADTD